MNGSISDCKLKYDKQTRLILKLIKIHLELNTYNNEIAVNIPKNIENTRDNDHGWLLYTFPSVETIKQINALISARLLLRGL